MATNAEDARIVRPTVEADSYELQDLGSGPDARREYSQQRPEASSLPVPEPPAPSVRAEDSTPSLFPRSISLPLRDARDHLANERTFLAYIRTSTACAQLAVVILQLFRLKHTPSPGAITQFDLGVPVALALLCFALIMALASAWRFAACQRNLVAGRWKGPRAVVMVCTSVAVTFFLALLILASVVPND